jgi:hypothetical protein
VGRIRSAIPEKMISETIGSPNSTQSLYWIRRDPRVVLITRRVFLPFSGLPYFWIFLALIPLAIPVVFFLIAYLISLVDKAESSPLSSTATLTCYHCGQETAATAKTCQQCGGELQ